MYQQMRTEGATLVVTRSNRIEERHPFETSDEAVSRMRTLSECLTWLGTPFRDCCDVRGRIGGVDCAMFLVRSFVDSGRLSPFDPRPYPTQWMYNQDGERFLEWIEGTGFITRDDGVLCPKLGGRRVPKPRVGDVILYQYGRCFAHGAIMINSEEIAHAYKKAQSCVTSLMRESDIDCLRSGKPRPKLFFEVSPC